MLKLFFVSIIAMFFLTGCITMTKDAGKASTLTFYFVVPLEDQYHHDKFEPIKNEKYTEQNLSH